MKDPYQPPAQEPPPLPTAGGEPPALGDNLGMRMLMPVGLSGWAIAAGYLGLFSLLILPAPLAIPCSLMAIRNIRKSKTSGKLKRGMGRAVFGLVMGVLGTVGLAIVLLPNFWQS